MANMRQAPPSTYLTLSGSEKSSCLFGFSLFQLLATKPTLYQQKTLRSLLREIRVLER
jgi:hypothetical protein